MSLKRLQRSVITLSRWVTWLAVAGILSAVERKETLGNLTHSFSWSKTTGIPTIVVTLSSYFRTLRRELNSCRCVGMVTLTCGKRDRCFFRISSSFILCCACVFTFVFNRYFSRSSSLNQLIAIIVYCYLNWRSSSRWTLQPEIPLCSDGRTREMYFGLFCNNTGGPNSRCEKRL